MKRFWILAIVALVWAGFPSTGSARALSGTLDFHSATVTFMENDLSGMGSPFINVDLLGWTGGGFCVSTTFAGGTATPGSDFTDLTNPNYCGSQPAGDWPDMGFLFSGLIDDALSEPDETYTISLSQAPAPDPGYEAIAIGLIPSVEVTIVDDDGGGGGGTATGAFSFAQSSYTVAENGTLFNAEVLRSGGSSGVAQVDVGFDPGTATSNVDFGGGYVGVPFADGQSSAAIAVYVYDDGDTEPDETFSLSLSNPTNGTTLGSPTMSTVTILDDESGSAPMLAPRTIDIYVASPNPHQIGDDVLLTGYVYDVDGSAAAAGCIGNQTVYIYRDMAGGDAVYDQVTTALTDSFGYYQTYSPVLGAANYFAFVAADSTCGAAGSPDAVVDVEEAPPAVRTLELKAKPRNIDEPRKVKFTAELTPCENGDRIILEVKKGPSFKKVDVATLGASCKAVFNAKVKKTAKYRARTPAKDAFPALTSALVRVKVMA